VGVAALDMMRPAVLAAAAAAAAEGAKDGRIGLGSPRICDRDDDEAARKGAQMLGGSEMVTEIDQCCWRLGL
jgi:alkanesulfonate monooxygenase SsuD/methylene tetrahydromethanopterin reductase-like flavin-dependent oxidoreductase (luciferase family)